jgi:hypothetical protein
VKIFPVILNTGYAALTVFLIACGSETKETNKDAVVNDNRENGMTFVAEADLPSCTSAREGFLVYVKETSNFRTCTAGAWSAIDLKGEKGDTGSGAASMTEGLSLYKKYKHSIFRVEISCDIQANAPAQCAGKTAGIFSGTAFLCGDKSVCTNIHVVSCPTCYELKNLELQAIAGDSDSVNSTGQNGGSATPFFKSTTNSMVKFHDSKDLARFPITQNPPKAIPLPLSTKIATEVISPLMPILSISYPLGFQDLYVDIGSVISPKLGQCDDNDPKYGCLAEYYAFATSNNTDHGSSGSPLIDIATGEVVGLTTAGTSQENANYTWATDASFLKDIP